MKGDFAGFAIVPVVFLIVVVVTAIMIQAYQQITPIINASLSNVNAPASYYTTYTNIGNNLYSFNIYLPTVFMFVMMGALVSLLFISPNPISWLVGVVVLPFAYYISLWESNIAKQVLEQPILAQGMAHLGLPQQIFANLDIIIAGFAFVYIILLAIRLYFHNLSGAPQGTMQTKSGY